MRKIRVGLTVAFAVIALSAVAQDPPPCRLCKKQMGNGALSAGKQTMEGKGGTQGTGETQGTGGTQGKGTLVQKSLSYNLAAARVGSGDVVEFTPMDVSYTLTVGVIGIGGPDPTPTDIEICPNVRSLDPPTVCAKIPSAVPTKTYKGTISVPAPVAGLQSPLTIVATAPPPPPPPEFTQRKVVAEAVIPVDVGANYDVAITSFETITTRATSTDTVWTSLQGIIKSSPPHPSDNPEACQLAGFSWCVKGSKSIDSDGGKHDVPDVRVSPYFLVPGREQDLRFLFYLQNVGGNPWQAIGEGVANGFSKAGMIILGAWGAASENSSTGSFAGQLDSIMEKAHNAEFASCDGDVATDVVVIPNVVLANQPQFTLDAFTRSAGVFSTTVPKVYENTDGDFRCDRRGGKYRVSYTVYRTSWREWGFWPTY